MLIEPDAASDKFEIRKSSVVPAAALSAGPGPVLSAPRGRGGIETLNVVLLAGGAGGAKLADGLAQLLPAENLTIIVNTGDDFQHLGLTICPDLDSVVYNLAGVANAEMGWGRANESWTAMTEVKRLGGPEWFQLGDLDLATHLIRCQLLANGANLTEVSQHICRHFGIAVTVLPMSNQPAPTFIETEAGLLPFQSWFVEKKWQPAVRNVRLPDDVRATPQVLSTLEKADLILIAPSNPFVSIDPILNVYPIRAMIVDLAQAVVAVSPLIAGQAVKGPAAKMMQEMGMPVTSAAIARYYNEIIDAFVCDQRDRDAMKLGGSAEADLPLLVTDTLMNSRADRVRLAQAMLSFSMELLEP